MLNSHDLMDRRVIAAIREYDELNRKRFTIVKLDQPIQRGWRRLYVLTKHASTRQDSPFLESILAEINTLRFHHSRDFRQRRGRRRQLVEIDQPLRPIPLHEWERRNYPDEWFRYFRYELTLERNRHWQPYWVFTQPSLYELKIERNWLWHFREVDPAVETRLSELSRWLEARRGRQRYGRLKGHRQSYRWENNLQRHRSLEREHRKEINHALADFPEVDSKARAMRFRLSLWSLLPPSGTTLQAPVAQRRGIRLKPESVLVRVQPGALA